MIMCPPSYNRKCGFKLGARRRQPILTHHGGSELFRRAMKRAAGGSRFQEKKIIRAKESYRPAGWLGVFTLYRGDIKEIGVTEKFMLS
jgi:hypothetical protein